MKIISWNLNGLNASLKKGLIDFIKDSPADIFCFQETKTAEDRVDNTFLEIPDIHYYWQSAEKKGYSGVVTLSKVEPKSVIHGFNDEGYDTEGRMVTLEFENFYLVNTYFPNAGRGLKRLDFKLEWDKKFEKYVEDLRKKKPIILTGDLNVAHTEKDLARPKNNTKTAGFTPEEREWFDSFLQKGYIDTFREFVDERGHYTFWSYRHNAREKNIGWRLDYFVVSEELKSQVENSEILSDVYGSDHCPILLTVSE
ncbi:MAG: exodeoxyribonuclease III [Candidatus Lokiarchaeota archaeon]|nr:exodeoxyribonuclease III [Candidatus Lokiarchaeota archaeon]